jgi:hypothetical protein
MFFPFKIIYKKKTNVRITGNVNDILEIIRDLLPNECQNNFVKFHINGNNLIFLYRPLAKDFTIALEKGDFSVVAESDYFTITFTIYIFRFFIIYLSFFTIIAYLQKDLFSGWYFTFLFVGFLMWLGTVITHKLLLNKIVKQVENTLLQKEYKVQD